MCSGTPLAGAVFLDQPLARAAQLQPGTVNQQVDRSASRAGLRRQFQTLSAPAKGREIRYRQVEAEQLEDRADQPLSLAQRQVEHRAECQSCRNRKVGVVGLAARRGARRSFPGGNRILREPYGQTAPLPQRLVIPPSSSPAASAAECGGGDWHWLYAA